MNYGTAEQEIVDRINQFIASPAVGQADKYEADLMPETEAEFKSFYANFTKARVAVQYIDSNYDPSTSTGIVVQEEKARFRCTFEARKLRGEGGLYNLMQYVKLALIGWRLSDTDRLSAYKYGLLEFEQNAWQPYIEFECKTLNVQLHDDSEAPIGGSFQQLYQKNYNDKEFNKPFYSELAQ